MCRGGRKTKSSKTYTYIKMKHGLRRGQRIFVLSETNEDA